ncbi:hypothetical protein [Micromonospora sp. CA-248212]|uniref:hypothetical protein n=1 Tax=Micromonospora sp. CA-248212 TaxID=3239961 RepID=UPI003D941474
MIRLYHFTCSHAAPLIRQGGRLRAFAQPQLDGRKLIWLTDLEVPTRAQLGLTSHLLRCDRMEYRVTVEVDADRWVSYARAAFGSAKARRRAVDLGRAPGALPMHWWVTDVEAPVLLVERAR